MRHIPAFGLLAACSVAAPAWAAPAVCIDSYRIDHTEVPDDLHILFHMRDHSIYQASMQGPCTGLRQDTRGFTYEAIPGSDEICGNLLTIRLNTTHAVCMVGAMSEIRPARHK